MARCVCGSLELYFVPMPDSPGFLAAPAGGTETVGSKRHSMHSRRASQHRWWLTQLLCLLAAAQSLGCQTALAATFLYFLFRKVGSVLFVNTSCHIAIKLTLTGCGFPASDLQKDGPPCRGASVRLTPKKLVPCWQRTEAEQQYRRWQRRNCWRERRRAAQAARRRLHTVLLVVMAVVAALLAVPPSLLSLVPAPVLAPAALLLLVPVVVVVVVVVMIIADIPYYWHQACNPTDEAEEGPR